MKKIAQLLFIVFAATPCTSNTNDWTNWASNTNKFLMNLVIPGYKNDETQKAAAHEQISALQKTRTTTTNKEQLRVLDQQIYEQKVITGDAWSKRRRMILAGLALAGAAAIGFYGYQHYLHHLSLQAKNLEDLWQNQNSTYLKHRERNFINKDQVQAAQKYTERLFERLKDEKKSMQSVVSALERKKDLTNSDKNILTKYRIGLEILNKNNAVEALEKIDKYFIANPILDTDTQEMKAWYWIHQIIRFTRNSIAHEKLIPRDEFAKALYPEIANIITFKNTGEN